MENKFIIELIENTDKKFKIESEIRKMKDSIGTGSYASKIMSIQFYLTILIANVFFIFLNVKKMTGFGNDVFETLFAHDYLYVFVIVYLLINAIIMMILSAEEKKNESPDENIRTIPLLIIIWLLSSVPVFNLFVLYSGLNKVLWSEIKAKRKTKVIIDKINTSIRNKKIRIRETEKERRLIIEKAILDESFLNEVQNNENRKIRIEVKEILEKKYGEYDVISYHKEKQKNMITD